MQFYRIYYFYLDIMNNNNGYTGCVGMYLIDCIRSPIPSTWTPTQYMYPSIPFFDANMHTLVLYTLIHHSHIRYDTTTHYK